MDFELTEEQKSIKALVREFCKREVDANRLQEIADAAADATSVEEVRANVPYDLLEKANEIGLRQLTVPERYGGAGAGWLTRVIAAEEAGYWSSAMARLLSIMWKYSADMAVSGTKEQQDWFFSQIMENPRLYLAAAISEPDGSTDIFLPYNEPGVAMRTLAHKEGYEWVINGNKMYCSGGAGADLILVSVRTDKNGPITESMSQFWVEKDTPGLEMTLNKLIAADMTGNVQIHFDNVRVPERNLVGEVNKAWKMMSSRVGGMFTHYAGLLGASQRIYELMKDYAKERIGGGRPIFEHTNIGAMIAEARINLEATRALFYRAAWQADHEEQTTGSGAVDPFWGYACNYYYKKMALRFCEIGAEVYAGMAIVKGMPFESYIRYLYGIHHGGSTPNMNLIKCMPYL
jgi:alkylation response protein AidB-like acyl-CoA dehydrogenase